MAWPENLTAAQQAMITYYVDQVFRPNMLPFVTALSDGSDRVIPGALASPSGASSTFSSPAADSVLGLLGTLNGADFIPFSATNPTGLAGAQQFTVADAIAFIGAINTLVQTYWQLPNQQAFSLIVGAPNL
jgi:hypothetical protein